MKRFRLRTRDSNLVLRLLKKATSGILKFFHPVLLFFKVFCTYINLYVKDFCIRCFAHVNFKTNNLPSGKIVPYMNTCFTLPPPTASSFPLQTPTPPRPSNPLRRTDIRLHGTKYYSSNSVSFVTLSAIHKAIHVQREQVSITPWQNIVIIYF